jgi:hypothetical protein
MRAFSNAFSLHAQENKNWRKTITISSKAKMAASVAAAGGVGHGAGGDAAHHQPQQDLIFSRSFQLRHLAPTALPDTSTATSRPLQLMHDITAFVDPTRLRLSSTTERGHCFGLVTEFDQPVAKFYTADPNEREEWLAELHAVKKAIAKSNKARKGSCVPSADSCSAYARAHCMATGIQM